MSTAELHKRLAVAVRQSEAAYAQAATAPLHIHGTFDEGVSFSKQHLASLSAATSLASMESRVQEMRMQMAAMEARLQEVMSNQHQMGLGAGFFGASTKGSGERGGGGGVSGERYFTNPEAQFVRRVTSEMIRPLQDASVHQERLLLDVIATLNFAVENRAFVTTRGAGKDVMQRHMDADSGATGDELHERVGRLRQMALGLRSGWLMNGGAASDNLNQQQHHHDHELRHHTPIATNKVTSARQPSAAPSYDVEVSPETVTTSHGNRRGASPAPTTTTAASSSTAGYRQPSSTPTTTTTTTTTTASGGTTTDEEAFFKGFSRRGDFRDYFPTNDRKSMAGGGANNNERFGRLLDITSSSEDDFLTHQSPHWGQLRPQQRMLDNDAGRGDSSTTTSSGQKAGKETSFVEAVQHIVSGAVGGGNTSSPSAVANQRSVHFGEETVYSHPTDGFAPSTGANSQEEGSTTLVRSSENTRANEDTTATTHRHPNTTNFTTLLSADSDTNDSRRNPDPQSSRTNTQRGGGAGEVTSYHHTAFTSGFDSTPLELHVSDDGSVVSAVVPSTANTSGVVAVGGYTRENHDRSGGYTDAYHALNAHLR